MRILLLGVLLLVPAAEEPDWKEDEVVEFVPTFAVRSADGKEVRVRARARVYEPEEDSPVRQALTGLLRKALGLGEEAEDNPLYRERAMAFLVDHEEGRQVGARAEGAPRESFVVAESGDGGWVEWRWTVPAASVEPSVAKGLEGEAWIPVRGTDRHGADLPFRGAVQVLPERGVLVVSDLDDTLRVTAVRDRKELLANTFLRPWRPVEGMAAVFSRWRMEGASFHYLTAAPWQLLPVLERFLSDGGFPRGSATMREFRWKDGSFLALFGSPGAYKRERLETLLEEVPRLRLVLVGDSGEEDPEAYGAVARAHPDRVAGIFIRDVVEGGAPKERWEKAFEGIPEGRWRVFTDPAEVGELPR